MVIFSHSYWLTGNQLAEPLHNICGMLDFGSLGVKLFFCISGFLITKSLYRQQNLGNFVWARLIRIFPGLFFSSVFCAWVIGPLSTTLSTSSYFADNRVYSFIWHTTLLYNWPNTLPGVFLTNPIKSNVNSALWTLPGEIFMYSCVVIFGALIYVFKLKFKQLILFPVIITVYLLLWGIPGSGQLLKYIASWGVLFAAGAVCFLLRHRIKLSIPAFFVACIVFLLLFHYRFILIAYAFDLLLCYGIMLFAYHPRLKFRAFLKIGDLSYGLYIYALPVQQLIIAKFGIHAPWREFMICYPIALILAALSWNFIEKPSLRLKNVSPVSLLNKKEGKPDLQKS